MKLGQCIGDCRDAGRCQHRGVFCMLKSATNTQKRRKLPTSGFRNSDATGEGTELPEDDDFVLSNSSGDDQILQLSWTAVEQFRDYDNPLSPGALVKAALVYLNIVDVQNQDEDLDGQLAKYGGWLELEIHSRLPPGSGLGGSSLVGGALLSVLRVLISGSGAVSVPQIVHETLALEQCMTTGGGWQDQVGGLYGGVKLGVSYNKLPVAVESYNVPVTAAMLENINARLLLLYTGQVRLAKNLLQNVVRSWYSGDSQLHATFHRLQKCAITAAEHLIHSNFEGLCVCINDYWRLKKTVAPGSEPQRVTELMSQLLPHVSCMSLAGAGGGGYLYALTKTTYTCNHSQLSNISTENKCQLVPPLNASIAAESTSGLPLTRSHQCLCKVLGGSVSQDSVEVSTSGLVVTIQTAEVFRAVQAELQLDATALARISRVFGH